VKNYRILLAHPSIREQQQLKQIVQEKLDAAQKFKKNQNSESNSSRASSDEARDIGIINFPGGLRQITTTISHQKSVDDLNTNAANTG
jgi:hypothetical protein